MKYVIEWFRGRDGQFYWSARRREGGKIVLSSEGYTRAWSARRAARKVAGALGGAEVRER